MYGGKLLRMFIRYQLKGEFNYSILRPHSTHDKQQIDLHTRIHTPTYIQDYTLQRNIYTTTNSNISRHTHFYIRCHLHVNVFANE